MNNNTTITFKLTDEQVFTRLSDDLRLTIMPSNDNLCFRLCYMNGIIADGVDYKNTSTMQAAINRALRWHNIKVKLLIVASDRRCPACGTPDDRCDCAGK